MPNVRKKGKKFIGAWIPEKLHEKLQALAAQRGCALSDVIDELLTEYARLNPIAERLPEPKYPPHRAGEHYALNDPNSRPASTASNVKVPVMPGTDFDKLHQQAVDEEAARRLRDDKAGQASDAGHPPATTRLDDPSKKK